MRTSSTVGSLFIVVLCMLLSGCENKPPPPVDLVEQGLVQTEGSSDAMVEVSAPRLVQYDLAMEIKGSVTRQPGMDGPVSGRLEALVLSPGGTVMHRLPLSWTPFEIPTTGSRASSYLVRFIETPPRGSTVRVVHVNPPVATQ